MKKKKGTKKISDVNKVIDDVRSHEIALALKSLVPLHDDLNRPTDFYITFSPNRKVAFLKESAINSHYILYIQTK